MTETKHTNPFRTLSTFLTHSTDEWNAICPPGWQRLMRLVQLSVNGTQARPTYLDVYATLLHRIFTTDTKEAYDIVHAIQHSQDITRRELDQLERALRDRLSIPLSLAKKVFRALYVPEVFLPPRGESVTYGEFTDALDEFRRRTLTDLPYDTDLSSADTKELWRTLSSRLGLRSTDKFKKSIDKLEKHTDKGAQADSRYQDAPTALVLQRLAEDLDRARASPSKPKSQVVQSDTTRTSGSGGAERPAHRSAQGTRTKTKTEADAAGVSTDPDSLAVPTQATRQVQETPNAPSADAAAFIDERKSWWKAISDEIGTLPIDRTKTTYVVGLDSPSGIHNLALPAKPQDAKNITAADVERAERIKRLFGVPRRYDTNDRIPDIIEHIFTKEHWLAQSNASQLARYMRELFSNPDKFPGASLRATLKDKVMADTAETLVALMVTAEDRKTPLRVAAMVPYVEDTIERLVWMAEHPDLAPQVDKPLIDPFDPKNMRTYGLGPAIAPPELRRTVATALQEIIDTHLPEDRKRDERLVEVQRRTIIPSLVLQPRGPNDIPTTHYADQRLTKAYAALADDISKHYTPSSFAQAIRTGSSALSLDALAPYTMLVNLAEIGAARLPFSDVYFENASLRSLPSIMHDRLAVQLLPCCTATSSLAWIPPTPTACHCTATS